MNSSSPDLRPDEYADTGANQHTLSILEDLFQQALLSHQQGDTGQALDLYKQVMNIDPDHAESCFYTALLLGEAGSHDKALPFLEKAHERHPFLPAISYQLGICQYILGQNEPAIKSFEKVIDIDKGHWLAAYNLGAAYHAIDKIPEAIDAYAMAARLNPQDADIFFNLGLAYKKAGVPEEALKAYCKAIEIKPEDPEVHYNLGRLYNDTGHKKEAILSLEMAIGLRPDFGAALTNLGVLYSSEDMRDKAIAVYEKLIKIGHNPTAAQHILNALKGNTTDAAPIAYIKELYDDFAGHFEKRLLGDLGYNTPQKLVNFLQEHNGTQTAYAQMLDLGCGTGLCGQAFAGMTGSITGVDLSAKMIEKARDKNIYDQLVEDNIISFLENPTQAYDLIVAGDVLIYLGELKGVFQLLPKSLSGEGKIIFSTEHFDGKGYKLRSSGRYAHSKSYINVLAQEKNLQISAVESTNLRKENGQWIVGEIYIISHSV